MSASGHDAIVRSSFEKQTALFAGEDALFARRSSSALAWLEPLDPEMIVLDVACGAAHAAEKVAPHVREAFDALHRRIDPSHAGVLLEGELAELLHSKVGPLTYGETSDPFTLPVDHILTDAADRDAVTSALQAELAGGPATGFEPVL